MIIHNRLRSKLQLLMRGTVTGLLLVITMNGNAQSTKIDQDEWEKVENLNRYLRWNTYGWTDPWPCEEGIEAIDRCVGLTVKDGKVTEIDLSGRIAFGELTCDIFAFEHLTSLDVSDCNLSNTIDNIFYEVEEHYPGCLNNLRNLNLHGNCFYGNAGVIGLLCPKLENLDISDNRIKDIYPPLPQRVKCNVGRQEIGETFDFYINKSALETMPTSLPTIALYDADNHTYLRDIDFVATYWTDDDLNYRNGWFARFNYDGYGKFTLREYSETDNVCYMYSGSNVKILMCDADGEPTGITFYVWLNYDIGDTNFDGVVDIVDLQTVIAYIFDEYKSLFVFYGADVKYDSWINVQDVVKLIDILLEQDLTPQQSKGRHAPPRLLASCQDGNLYISADRSVAAIDMVISDTDTEKLTSAFRDRGFECASRINDNLTHLIVYSMSGAILPAGITEISGVDGTVLSCKLVDSMAQVIETAATSSISDVSANIKMNFSNNVISINSGSPLHNLQWKVISADGRLISQGRDMGIAADVVNIPVAISSPGIYLLTVSADELPIFITKIIK